MQERFVVFIDDWNCILIRFRNRAEYIWILSAIAVAALVVFGSIHGIGQCCNKSVPVKRVVTTTKKQKTM